jgi:hypothetical protein
MTIDRELAVTGVPADQLDFEEEVTGVRAEFPSVPPPPGRISGGAPRTPQIFPQRDPMTGLVSAVSQRDIQAMTARLILEDPSLSQNPALATQMVNGFVTIGEQDPSLFDQFLEEPAAAMAQTTEEYLKLKALQQVVGTAFGDTGWTDSFDALITATREAYTRREGAIWSAGQLVNQMDAARGELELGTGRLDEVGKAAVADVMRERGINADNMVNAGQWVQAGQKAVDLAQAIEGRGGEWVFDDSGNLAITITEDVDGEESMLWQGLIRLDDGTEINDNLDALMALLQAQAGIKHRLADDADIPGRQTTFGLALETVGNTARFLERNGFDPVFNAASEALRVITNPSSLVGVPYTPSPYDPAVIREAEEVERLELSPTEYEKYEALREREQNRRRSMATPVNLIAAAAQTLEGDPQQQIVQAMGIWSSMSPDDQQTALSLAGQVDEEELLNQFREQREQQGVLSTSLQDYMLTPALEFAQTWERFVQDIATTFAHTANLSDEGAIPTLIGEGFDAFAESYNDALGNTEAVGDYWEMEDGAAKSWVNFGASVLFDPFTWITPTGKFQRQYMLKQLADPDLARNYIDTNIAFRDLARQIVDTDNVFAVETLVAGGIRLDAFDTLMRIANTNYKVADDVASDVLARGLGEGVETATGSAARNAATREVLDTLYNELPVRGGSWLPAGPSTLQVRQGTLGFGNVIRRFDQLSDKDRSVVYQLFARAKRSRSMSITEDGYVEDALRMITIRNADNPQKWADEVRRFYEDAILPFRGNTDQLRAVGTQVKERATRELTDIDSAMTPEIRAVPRLRAQVKQLDNQIEELQGQIVRAAGDPEAVAGYERALQAARTVRDSNTRRLEELGPAFDDGKERALGLRRELTKAEDAIKSSMVPRDRSILEQWAHRYMDEWADELGIEVVPGKSHPFIPDLPMRQWENVTGDKSFTGLTGEKVDQMSPLADDATGAAELRQLGSRVGDRGWTPLPASVMEMIAYGAGNDTTRALLRSNAAKATIGVVDAQQRLFTMAVLTNFVTPIKTNVDEVLRFWTQIGVTDTPTLMQALLGGTPGINVAYRKLRPVTTRAQRANQSPVDMATHNWRVLEPGDAGHWQAAERWVNGQLLEDPIFKEYARVMVANGSNKVAAREAFKKWWDETGSFFANTSTIRGQELNYRLAFNIMDESFGVMTTQAADTPLVTRRILEAAAKNEKIGSSNSRFWSQVGRVPGEEVSPSGAARWSPRRAPDAAFNSLYGTTGSYRGGVFFDYYYDEALDLYRNSANILDADTLLARSPQIKTLDEAHRALAAGEHNAVIRDLVTKQGYQLERNLEILAARWARNRADDMMYQMGAASMFGRKTARLYPFGRAQTDFLDYWFRQAAQPLQFKVPGGNKLITPKLPGGRRIPLNARLYNRWAKLAAQADPEGQDPALSPGWLVRRFTFLPTQLDEGFLLDIVPSPSPLASWMVNFLPEDSPIRQTFTEIHPSHEVFSNYSNDGFQGSIKNLFDSTFPTSGRSLRSALEAAVKAFVSSTNIPEGEVWSLFNAMMINTESPYMRDYMGANFIEYATESSDIFDLAISDTGTMQEQFLIFQQQAFSNAYGQDAFDYLKANLAVQNQAGSDALYVRGYIPMIDQIQSWFDEGYFSAGVRDEFNFSTETVQAFLNGEGSASVSDKRRFADVASDIFYNLPDEVQNEFIVDHPEMATNLVSNFEVDMDLVPQELIDDGTVASGRIVARGEQGREAWRRGFSGEDGATWIVLRDQEEVWFDRVERAHGHARNYIRDYFESATGLKWEKVRSNTKNREFDLRFSSDEDLAHFKRLTETLNVVFPDDALQTDGSYRMTLGEFHDALKQERNSLGGPVTIDTAVDKKLLNIDALHEGSNTAALVAAVEDSLGWDLEYDPAQDVSYYGSQLVDDIKSNVSYFEGEFDWRSPAEWEDRPELGFDAEEAREHFRQRLRTAITLNPDLTVADYNKEYVKWFGDLNYEAPDPPPVAELVNAHQVSSIDEINVEDGDTIHVYTNDGEMVPFRLLGLNSPEEQQPGFEEAKAGLSRLVNDALERGETITFGSYDPGRFGTTQLFRSERNGLVVDNERIFAWLYIGDTAVFDPEAFTSLDPRGQRYSSGVPDYQSLYNQRRQGGE